MRVLGCGFHKTATSSLRHALEHLGYQVANYNPTLFDEYMAGRRARIWWNARRFTAYRDWPWALMWLDFDRTRWVSRFVLTIRDPDNWYTSLAQYIDGSVEKWGAEWVRVRMRYLYGVDLPRADKDACIRRFLAHNAQIEAHFSRHPGRLLIFDAESGDGWEKLCWFLGAPIPDIPFPHKLPDR